MRPPIYEGDYLNNIDDILAEIFNSSDFLKQPRFIIEIGSCDGLLLAHAFNYIKKESSRGKKLTDYPLQLVALVLDADSIESIRINLAETPHQITQITDTSKETILSALHQLSIQEPSSALYLYYCKESLSCFNNYDTINSDHGLLVLQKHSLSSDSIKQYRKVIEEPKKYPEFLSSTLQTAEQFLLSAAGVGWTPKSGMSFHYPTSYPIAQMTLNCFEYHDYIIRQATLKDLPALVHLEQLCWPEPLWIKEDQLAKRINNYPEGQLVLETKRGVEGVVYSQRIIDIESLYHKEASTVHTLHDANGHIVQLLALNILPEVQHLNFGSQLLEFMLQLSSVLPNVTHVVGVTRCVKYPGKETIGIDAYLNEKTAKGQVVDPVPRMHVQHGAEIRGTIPNYRPKDEANDGYGVLVIYSLRDRSPMVNLGSSKITSTIQEEITPEMIGATVDSAIIEIRWIKACNGCNDCG